MSGHSEMRIKQTYYYLSGRERRQRGPPNVKQAKRRGKYTGLKYG